MSSTSTSSRERQFAKLRKLGKQRDAKRNEMEDIFQRKRVAVDREADLMQQLRQLQKELQQRTLQLQGVKGNIEQADREMNLVNEALFDLDDQITTLEESLGVDADSNDMYSETPTEADTRPIPLTAHPDEILPDPSSQWTQPQDVLTDPCTQLPSNGTAAAIFDVSADHSDDDTIPQPLPRRSSALPSSTFYSRPQLVLQPVTNHRRTSTLRPDHVEKEDRKPAAREGGLLVSAQRIQATLQETFGIAMFRENQLPIIQATMAQEDCFVIMRTGGGKSLLYQLPAVLERPQHKLTLVISPLLSLMQGRCDVMLVTNLLFCWSFLLFTRFIHSPVFN